MNVMNIKRIAAAISCSLMTVVAHAAVLPATQTDSQWFKYSAANVAAKAQVETKKTAKNVILLSATAWYFNLNCRPYSARAAASG